MGRRSLGVLGLLALASLGHAQEIHKCTGEDGVTYQSIPCPPGKQEQAFASVARNQEQASASAVRNGTRGGAIVAARSREANRYAGTPFAATAIFIGMTDTQVLNLAGWGRPTQIARTKAKQGWRELWTYKDAAEQWRLLYFENGRVVTREETPAPSMQARISTEQ